MSILMKDRLFPREPSTRTLARQLFEKVENIPIISPHGHTEARWFSENLAFDNPTDLFVTPDHYVYRMLISQGISLDEIGLKIDGSVNDEKSNKAIWNIFAAN